jgi:hypothetical protein
VGLHESKKLLYKERNGHQTEEAAHTMEKFYASYTTDNGAVTRIHREMKKPNSQRISEPMEKWANELNRAFSKEEFQMAKKTQEEMFSIPGHKENAIQNHFKIPPDCC